MNSLKPLVDILQEISNHIKNLDRSTILNSLIAIVLVYVAILLFSFFIKRKSKKWFTIKLISTVITGGIIAFMLPYALDIKFEGPGNDGGALRQQILLATGGILALVTLLENRKKNENEKERNEKDYQRQVEDERRERYIKSLDLLGNNEFPINLSGMYSLCKIADEWLEENNDLEAQNIIDILCAYIRSPYSLALYKYTDIKSKQFFGEHSSKNHLSQEEFHTLEKEKTLRKAIIDEITKRTKIRRSRKWKMDLWDRTRLAFISHMNNENISMWKMLLHHLHELPELKRHSTRGPWSHLNFDLSGSLFFYPTNFEMCRWSGSLDISRTTHIYEFNISNSIFDYTANFKNNIYCSNFISYKTWFTFKTSFHECIYYKDLIFNLNYHWELPQLTKSVFLGRVKINDSLIHESMTLRKLNNHFESGYIWSINNSYNTYLGPEDITINYKFPRRAYLDTSNSKISDSKKCISIQGDPYDVSYKLPEGFNFLTSDEEEKISHDLEHYINEI